MRSTTILAVLSTLASMSSAHMAIWHEAGLYDEKPNVKDRWDGSFNPRYTPVVPMGKDNSIKVPAGGFWFHGADLSTKRKNGANNKKVKLRAGGTTTLEIACGMEHTNVQYSGGQYTNGANYGRQPEKDACPEGEEVWKSRHVSPNGPETLLGCGLAITTKNPGALEWNLDNIKPQDLTVFSVKNDCIKKRDTTFSIPADMPQCPPEGCVCAWFWQGQDSNDEMYMTGFLCEVEGGKSGLKLGNPQPAKYCGDGKTPCITGPKQPLIWANEGSGYPMNVQKAGQKKPGYIPSWGFNDGAQVITGGGGSAFTPPALPPTSTPPKNEENNVVDQPFASCSWADHCLGARCNTNDDCSDDLICTGGKCSVSSNLRRRRSVLKRGENSGL